MNCLLHIHITAEERDLLLFCHRTVEEPNTVYIDRVIVDGIAIQEEFKVLFLQNHQTMIYSEMSRKLHIKRNALTLSEIRQ